MEGDRWARGQPLPSRGPGAPSGRPTASLHKTESAFKAGLVLTDDPGEETKQKQFKGILNKLTPDNFEKLSEKVREG